IGFLFSGQGSPLNTDGGIWARRFENIRNFYAESDFKEHGETVQTAVAQPAIVTASICALQIFDKLDITAQVGIGHSLGELTALHWAGVFDEKTLVRIAEIRGRAMTETSEKNGAMLSVSADKETVENLLKNYANLVIAGLNAPHQTVVSGEAEQIERFQFHLKNQNIASVKLPVSHAFHSPLVAKSAEILAEKLQNEDFQPLQNIVFSTVAGEKLSNGEDLRELLCRQITNPVLFTEAVEKAEKSGVDLWIEVGTGKILRGLVEQISRKPAFAIESSSENLRGLLQAVGAAFALGQEINQEAIFAERFTKPFNLDWQPKFFANPCELAPLPETNAFPVLKVEKTKPVEEVQTVEETTLTTVETIIKLIAERAELPLEAVHEESRMLSDLHLNSITVGQIVTTAAKIIGAPPPLVPTGFADAKVTEIADALETLKENGGNVGEKNDLISGLETWVRPFKTEFVRKDLANHEIKKGAGNWQIFAANDYPLTEKIRNNFNDLEGFGVVVCVQTESDAPLLLEGAKKAIESKNGKFVIVQHEKSFAAFARSFALENLEISIRVVTLPLKETAIEHLLCEVSAEKEIYSEALYDENGNRFAPLVRSCEIREKSEILLDSEDVLLVTGGAKGITAECVLALARETGVKLALLGTSAAEIDEEVKNNLGRFRIAGVDFVYFSADVTDAEEVKNVVAKAEEKLGKITAILHAAAKNEPKLVAQSDENKLRKTISVKLDGARNLVSAIPSEQLKFFITFGSIIARTGLTGESDYGLANELLSQFTEDFQQKNPHCKCIAFEWSVWAGIGMGTRIADLDSLIRRGILPIPLEKGVKTFLNLLKAENLPTSFVVMSRFCDVPAFNLERKELPFQRFLEQTKVYFPKTELVVEVELSTANDLYLADHEVGGEKLFPAVLGLEAMAQTASALLETEKTPSFENLKFSRPIVVSENKPLKIRILALSRDEKTVEVAIRSAETDFQTDHFYGVCSFADVKETVNYKLNGHADSHVDLDPKSDLYGKILFHRGRFQRLSGYKQLEAKECLAEISFDGKNRWFSQYLPKTLLLGDPAMRDTAIHAIQACIPHATLLPISVENISILETSDQPHLVHAQEISQDGNVFKYDLQILDLNGKIVEFWQGLRLQMVNGSAFTDKWIEPLLAVYLARKTAEMFENFDISVALEREVNLSRRERSYKAMQAVLGGNSEIAYRTDGKPETASGKFVSASHTGNLTLAVIAKNVVTCDVETVIEREKDVWKDLLSEQGFKLAEFLSSEQKESFHSSATRIWTLKECLQKAETSFHENPVLREKTDDGWMIFECENYRLASYIGCLKTVETETVFTFLSEKQ
ncbi:MAG TPA: SDR family NAD(P)-dependent oxidoreductase, partial [Pyrinomonadaceae bacterium]|nr:SDR family NAD(P)-dependent oxidoreductase [Pyrinomonadaceae bacterium]